MKFKVGDKVIVNCKTNIESLVGKRGTIIRCNPDGTYETDMSFDYRRWREEELDHINCKGAAMSLVSKAKQLTLSKEERLLRKHGVHNVCGELTDDGKEVLWTILEEAYKIRLVELVTEIDKEDKKDKKDGK